MVDLKFQAHFGVGIEIPLIVLKFYTRSFEAFLALS